MKNMLEIIGLVIIMIGIAIFFLGVGLSVNINNIKPTPETTVDNNKCKVISDDYVGEFKKKEDALKKIENMVDKFFEENTGGEYVEVFLRRFK